METIKIEELKVLDNIRKDMGDMKELEESIKEHGILTPLIATEDKTLVAGHRRLQAAKNAGIKEVPVVFFKKKNNKQWRSEVQILENVHRKDLDAVEEGKAFQDYIKQNDSDVKNLSYKIKKTTQYIQRRIEINKAAPEVKTALKNSEIEIGHAILLGQMKKDQQKISIESIKEFDLTVQNFSDQIRWMKKIDFGNLKFRPSKEINGQTTIFDSIGQELDPLSEVDSYGDLDLKSNNIFKKEISDYVESQRKMLRDKGINVFASEGDLINKHPEAEEVNNWDGGYTKIVKGLPKSKNFAIVVDFGNYDIEKQIYRLKKKDAAKDLSAKDLKKAAKSGKVSKKEMEEAEETLELSRKQKLQSRVEFYKRKLFKSQLEEFAPEDGKLAKVLAVSALMHNVENIFYADGYNELSDFIEYSKKGEIGFLNTLKEDVLDSWIKKLGTSRYNSLDNAELFTALKLSGFELKKHWTIDEDYLELHTKAQLEELIKEFKLVCITEGKKGDIIAEILKCKLNGKVPKIMLKNE